MDMGGAARDTVLDGRVVLLAGAEKSVQRGHQSQWIGPVEFVSSDPLRASEHIISLASAGDGQGRHVHLANAYTVALADRSVEYRDILAAPKALNFPDGKPIGWISALRGHTPRLIQVRGPQLFLDVFDNGRAQGLRHFLLGSTPQVLESLVAQLTERYPGVLIVGIESPPFRVLTTAERYAQDERILQSGADVVWVGLGTPKQDVEAQRLANGLPVVAIAIGAAFDFTAGSTPEAPTWMTTLGLEWFYRLLREPGRLWKRYFFGNARFLKAALFTPMSGNQGA
jgi:N-acetylglucosaminyldiphosphoundecaprenol N-acetyl-beta-D-mannosaminyltransferase